MLGNYGGGSAEDDDFLLLYDDGDNDDNVDVNGRSFGVGTSLVVTLTLAHPISVSGCCAVTTSALLLLP